MTKTCRHCYSEIHTGRNKLQRYIGHAYMRHIQLKSIDSATVGV